MTNEEMLKELDEKIAEVWKMYKEIEDHADMWAVLKAHDKMHLMQITEI